MGMADWVRDSKLIEGKLAKAYGALAPDGVAELAEASTYNSTGIVLTIERHRKSEVQAKLAEAARALSSE